MMRVLASKWSVASVTVRPWWGQGRPDGGHDITSSSSRSQVSQGLTPGLWSHLTPDSTGFPQTRVMKHNIIQDTRHWEYLFWPPEECWGCFRYFNRKWRILKWRKTESGFRGLSFGQLAPLLKIINLKQQEACATFCKRCFVFCSTLKPASHSVNVALY